jgi:Kef-type K+ transport system membrane component KefB
VIGAFLFILIAKKIHSREVLLTLILGFIVFVIGITRTLHASQLLALIIFGLIVVSIEKELIERTLDAIEPLYEMLIPFFFILAGSTFEWQFAVQTFAIGITYTLALFASRYMGAFSGALIARSDKQTRNLIGLTLMPQAGVAFGLILVMHQLFGGADYGMKGQELIRIVGNTLIWTTLITETVGPLLTRFALSKAGEIGKNDHPFPSPE